MLVCLFVTFVLFVFLCHAFAQPNFAANNDGYILIPPRQSSRVPRRAGADGKSRRSLQRPSNALEVQQEPSDSVQSRGFGRRSRRDGRDSESRQRRELLRGIEELHGRYEESSREV